MALNTKGYGAEVKRLAEEMNTTGLATLDLPVERSSVPGSEFSRLRSRATGYGRSLVKIFGRKVYRYEHFEDGERFYVWSFE